MLYFLFLISILFIASSSSVIASIIPLKSVGQVDSTSSLLIINCIDGSLMAFEVLSGKMLWKTVSSKGTSFSSSSITTGGDNIQFLIEPLGMGYLYMIDSSSPQNPISPVGLSLEKIVSESPLKLRDDSILLGQKTSTLHSINLENGIITSFAKDCNSFNDYNDFCSGNNHPTKETNSISFSLNHLGISHLRPNWAVHSSPLLWNTKYSSIRFIDVEKEDDSLNSIKITSSFNGSCSFGPHSVALDSIGISFLLIERDFLLNVLRVLELKIEKNDTPMINMGLSPDGSLFALPDSLFPLEDLHSFSESSVWVPLGSHHCSPSFRAPFANQIPLLSDGFHKEGSFKFPFATIFITITFAFLISFKFLPKLKYKTKNRTSNPTTRNPPPGFENITTAQSNSLFLAQEEKSNNPLSFTISSEVLGYGSHGTVVFSGSFEGRPVAIKRMLPHFFSLAEHEISLLQSLDDHPNVIRYFFTERSQEFVYIVLERCSKTLQTVIDEEDPLPMHEKIRILRECTLGLQHLHLSNIIHRDIKPHNILLTTKGRVLLSDFGLCKMVPHDETSIAMSFQASSGTIGWRAPECILIEESEKLSSSSPSSSSPSSFLKVKKSMDIYSLGILFYFVLSDGRHPFGDRLGREMRIAGGEDGSFTALTDMVSISLIRKMLNNSAEKRPSLWNILKNPFFWEKEKRLRFLLDVSDRFELEDQRGNFSSLIRSFENIMKIESGAGGGAGWNSMIDQCLWMDINLHRKYNPFSYRDLLRAIRNKKNHFNELQTSIKSILGGDPEGIFENYFEKRFPFLFHKTWEWALEALGDDGMFSQKWF